MKIGSVALTSPLVVSPMAGMTDTAFRRLVKRHGGCGLVVSEMVSSEGLVRGIDRTLEYAEYTEEERPVSIQIFGGEPDRMAEAARVVEGMGADIVDVNMGCPVPKVAKHNAGCSLMREPAHAAAHRRGDGQGGVASRSPSRCARAGTTARPPRPRWRGGSRTPARRRSRSTAAPPSSRTPGRPTGTSSEPVAAGVTIPVFGSGDCIEPRADRRTARLGRERRVRRPRRAAQSVDPGAGAGPARRPADARSHRAQERAAFLLDYIDLLLARPRSTSAPASATWRPGQPAAPDRPRPARSRERWVINKVRALCTWYTKGFDSGSHLRIAVNAAESIASRARHHRPVLRRAPRVVAARRLGASSHGRSTCSSTAGR